MSTMDLIEEIYSSIDDDEAFARLPDTISALARSRSTLIYRIRNDDGACTISAYSHFTSAQHDLYENRYAFDNPWARRVQSLGLTGRAIALCDLVPEQEIMRSEFYHEFMRANGDDTGRCIGGEFHMRDSRLIIASHRALRARPYGDADVARMEMALRHVRRALSTRDELANLRWHGGLLESLLNQEERAMLVLGAGARVRYCNAAAEHILSGGHGMRLRGGHLLLAGAASQSALQRALDDILNRRAETPSSFAVPRRDAATAFEFRLSPLRLKGEDLCILTILDPARPTTNDWPMVARMFGLTPTELALVQELHTGRSLADIADSRHRSIETLRTQLKAIFQKTGFNRQSTLLGGIERLLRQG
ncbi:helix-turn-helix transcriptional regulator [Sandaracinobacter neustonicus]|uniref:Helix-turn-helix transcriptional regulator n=1 Tax=Sandaracinobacter neustonicus TaxID=1715348 RepID=A0A501XNS1_9SPHN|nr:helix-turn-helix transcriptional regulator [Sandaracinobacter neustonicus]TPE62226.1 helix-turn-helix transcriptional regulator [Sandaracinobacter neustonicus]